MRSTYALTLAIAVAPTSAGAQSMVDAVSPTVGTPSVASVGETVYEKSRLSVLPAYTVNESFTGKNLFATVTIRPGDKFVQIPSKSNLKACRSPSIDAFLQGFYNACLYDDDSDGKFDRYGGNEVQGGKKLPKPIAYERTQFVQPTSGSLKQVVIFLGSTSDSLRLSYREFVNDMARPAFTEEYTFPLSANYPQNVAFKGVRVKVSGIDGEGIHYEILSVPE